MAARKKKNVNPEDLIQEVSLDDLFYEAAGVVVDEVEKEVDIITFCEHPFYLDQELHASERFILKTFYGIPLDDDDRTIQVRTFPFDEKGVWMTEIQYCKFLIQQKRTNITDPNKIIPVSEIILACGRRSGKTFIGSIVGAYEAYKLIVKGNPQKYYKLPIGETIKIINVATATEQAATLAKAVQQRILNCKWFVPYVAGKNELEIRLRTKKDIELLKEERRVHVRALDEHASVMIQAFPCTARGIRSGSAIVGILDEFAHFLDNSGNRSGDKIYEALSPSLATFNNDGKILCLSSPYTKSGIFYDFYLDALNNPDAASYRMMFQIPSWEMNTTIQFSFLEKEKKKMKEQFEPEYGAIFSSVISGWIKYPELLDKCTVLEGEATSPRGNYGHYIAVDPAASAHGYALAMVHVEPKERTFMKDGKEVTQNVPIIVLDRWEVWNLGDPEFHGQDFIDPEVIEEYIEGLVLKFKIEKIAYDQFDSTSSVSKFRKMGLNAIKTPFSRSYNMKIFSKLKNLIYEEKIEFFPHELGIKELKNLEERKVGKKQYVAQAPLQGEVTTDDMADVIANASYLACEIEVENHPAMAVGTNGTNAFRASKLANGHKLTSHHAYNRRLRQHKFSGNLQKAMGRGRSK